MNKRKLRQEERIFDLLWDRVFLINAFAFELLSDEMQRVFKAENEELEKVTGRWLEKLYNTEWESVITGKVKPRGRSRETNRSKARTRSKPINRHQLTLIMTPNPRI